MFVEGVHFCQSSPSSLPPDTRLRPEAAPGPDDATLEFESSMCGWTYGRSRFDGVVSDSVINSWLARQLRQSLRGRTGALRRVSGQRYADFIWPLLEQVSMRGPSLSCVMAVSF